MPVVGGWFHPVELRCHQKGFRPIMNPPRWPNRARKGRKPMNEASLSHTRWDCTYHIVWIPKYRRKVLFQQSRPEVGSLLRRLFEQRGCEVVEGSTCPDHVHVCVRIPPKMAVSDVMGYVKGKSAMVLRDRHPEWGKVVGRDKTFWARGYYVSTVGLNEEAIRRYVAEQEEGSRFE